MGLAYPTPHFCSQTFLGPAAGQEAAMGSWLTPSALGPSHLGHSSAPQVRLAAHVMHNPNRIFTGCTTISFNAFRFTQTDASEYDDPTDSSLGVRGCCATGGRGSCRAGNSSLGGVGPAGASPSRYLDRSTCWCSGQDATEADVLCAGIGRRSAAGGRAVAFAVVGVAQE